MDWPELASRFESVLGEFRGVLGVTTAQDREVPEDVPHSLSKAVPQVSNHFMGGMAIRAGVAAVLNQRQFRLGISQDMIARGVNLIMKPRRLCLSHGGLIEIIAWR